MNEKPYHHSSKDGHLILNLQCPSCLSTDQCRYSTKLGVLKCFKCGYADNDHGDQNRHPQKRLPGDD